MECKTCSISYLELMHILHFISHSYDHSAQDLESFPQQNTAVLYSKHMLEKSFKVWTLKGKANTGMEKCF